MADANTYLHTLARGVAEMYAPLSGVRAIIVMGSVAEGHADFFSDLDMAVYYDTFPPEDDFTAARRACGGGERNWLIGDRDGGKFAESFRIDGIECQIAHATIAAWEEDMAVVLEARDVATPLQKAMSGILACVPLRGADLVDGWKARAAAFPDALAVAMIEKYLAFFPVWTMPERFLDRDASLWLHELLVQAEQNILGILAGINRLYYTTFQFKRQDAFVAAMPIAPSDLSARLKRLLVAEPPTAIEDLRELVREVVDLVDAQRPTIDTAGVRRQLDGRLKPWGPPVDIT